MPTRPRCTTPPLRFLFVAPRAAMTATKNQGAQAASADRYAGYGVAIVITGAGLDDGVAALMGLGQVSSRPLSAPGHHLRRSDIIITPRSLDREHRAGWRMEVKTRPTGTKGFTPLEKRWVMERTNAWNGRDRRNSKDDERKVESSAAMIQMSAIQLMLNRLAPRRYPAFHDRGGGLRDAQC